MIEPRLQIGCAGWSIFPGSRREFPGAGSHLERYASRFSSVEINSSFYRPHRPATYARWAATVGPHFAFSVKLPRAISHDARLAPELSLLTTFLDAASHLGINWRCLLIQLPPSFRWEKETATRFFQELRKLTPIPAVCEPRHASWFTTEVSDVFQHFEIGRVIADPPVDAAVRHHVVEHAPVYYRLHGSPRVYYSAYDELFLNRLAAEIANHLAEGRDCWCIFDNTAAGAASRNAADLSRRFDLAPNPVTPEFSIA